MKRTKTTTLCTGMLLSCLAVVALCLGSAGYAWADDNEAAKKKADGGDSKAEKDKDKKDKDEFPKFDEVVKDMEVKEGFFTLYYDKKKDTLLARIPKSILGEPFLVSISIAKGPFFAGWMMGGKAVYWKRMDKKLVLMEADTRYKKGKGSTVEDVIGRTYTDFIWKSTDIKTEAPGGDPVIDMGDLLKTDMIGLSDFYGGRKMDKTLSRWSRFKAFPLNVELAVDAALMGKKPTDRGIIASVHFSMSKLPENDYKPREADDRIGYFLTAIKDWAADHKDKTVFKRYVHRWNLQKQDPEASESPAKEPIVFYIEKTVPIQYRRYVREGILEWNKAFEKCGFLDAVQVRQQTDTNEFKDLDPEDVRYNFFRWIVSGRAFARGPSRANPYTGQILDADIVFDDSMVRFYVNDYKIMGPKAVDMFYDPIAEEFFENHPQWRFKSLAETLTPRFTAGRHIFDEPDISDPVRLLRERGEPVCELGAGMVHQLAFSHLLATRNGMRDLPDEYIGQVIKEIVMHEVGHTLGLRHNFKASTWLPMSEITSPDTTERPLSASVMDYNPVEFATTEDKQGIFMSCTLGPYDYWAIEYGYRPFEKDGDLKSEKEMLKSITDRVAEEGLAYATDEDTSSFGPDPYTYRFDNGDDPLAFAEYRMSLVDHLKQDMADWALEDGESYSRLRRVFNIILNEQSFAGRVVARLVGGQSVNRDHKGDPNARDPFEIVAADKQREALKFLDQYIFAADAFRFPPDLLNKLGAGRFRHWDSDEMDFIVDYNIHDRVRGIQSRVLTLLINPLNVNRIYDAQLKIPENTDALNVPELFDTLTAQLWSELDGRGRGPWTNRKPRISSFRRNLQREYLGRLIDIVLSRPGSGLNADSHAIVRMNVKGLGERIGETLEQSRSNLDAYTLAHLDEAKTRIDRVLKAEFTAAGLNARRGSVRFFFGQDNEG
ncbi:MAG: zinc-dependent metalloprotease, partial [Planctomycetes bacterium]|nr:zinc-dependent metalloprotease [Planctomycetota bacterium]